MKELITKLAAVEYGTVTEIEGAGQGEPEKLKDSVMNIINWILGVIAIICVIVIIIGGIQYMTSTGDPGKVKKAEDTILYAIIGLVVVILAAAIVNFVIGNITTVAT